MEPEIGIGLVGYGGIGRLHALCYRMLPIVYPRLPVRARLVAVVTAGAASAERARAELGAIVATTALEDVLRPEITLVDCCAPTGDHAAIGAAALAAGKALYCEKPLTADVGESRRLLGLAQARGLAGGVHYHFRGIPALQQARRMIGEGLLGEVRGFSMRYFRASNLRADRPLTWRFGGPGSGVLADLGSHLIDLTHYLLGPIDAVSARLRTFVAERPDGQGGLAPVAADDDAWLSVTLAGGGVGTIAASKVVPGAADDIRIEVYGANGALFFDTRDPNVLQVAEGAGAPTGGRTIAALSRATPAATVPGAETPTATLSWHLAALAGFLEALGNGTPPPTDLAAGLAVDRVIAAARHSSETGGAWTGIDTSRAEAG